MDFKRAREAFAAGNVDRVCAELKALIPEDPEIHRLQEFAKFALEGGTIPQCSEPSSSALLRSIADASRSNRSIRYPGRHYISRELDFVADLGGVEGWGLLHALNRLTLDNLAPKKQCAVVGTMRDDGIYIMEWVAHYMALGFDHIFIYTNDNADSSIALLELLAQHGVITLIESEVTGEVPPEAKAFGHALNLLTELRDYEWALFVDSDELLVTAPRFQHSIRNVLVSAEANFSCGRLAAICYDWLWFISDMVFERKPGLLCERFQHARPHWLSKCLVRIREVQSMRLQHYPEVTPGCLVVDSEFKPLDMASIWERRVAQYGGGRINHYWPKSFQEFAIKKARGASLGGDDNLYDRPYQQFFTWNGYSTNENAFLTENRMLLLIKHMLARLREMSNVAATADRIDDEFRSFLSKLAYGSQLRNAYQQNAGEPGDL